MTPKTPKTPITLAALIAVAGPLALPSAGIANGVPATPGPVVAAVASTAVAELQESRQKLRQESQQESQQKTRVASEDLRWYRVSAGNAFVRSDASATVAYPIGRIPEGTVLPVTEERFGWARIRGGETLGDLHGFIPAETAAVSEDGRFVMVSVRTPLKAANLAARQDPARSWKEVARVEPGDRLQLVETVGSGGEAFHKVVLPASAAAWINLAFLSPATPEEIRSARPTLAAKQESSAGELELVARPNGTRRDEQDATDRPAPAPAVVAATEATIESDASAEEAIEVATAASADETFVDIEAVERTADRDRLAEPRLEDLESIWTRISEAPETPASDVEELRGRYVALASAESSTAAVRARATLRAEQLTLQQQIQNRLGELRRLQERNLMNLQAIRDVRAVIESRTDYEAVGRLNTSLVYDGKRLPLLYRLQEAGEGATVAYLIPTSDFRLAELTGQLVGVDGVVRYDEALRLNIITPDRVEVLQESSP